MRQGIAVETANGVDEILPPAVTRFARDDAARLEHPAERQRTPTCRVAAIAEDATRIAIAQAHPSPPRWSGALAGRRLRQSIARGMLMSCTKSDGGGSMRGEMTTVVV